MIATAKSTTRVGIASEIGLSKMSVSNIVDEFIQSGSIEESEQERSHNQGRNPVRLRFTDHAPKTIGIIINRDHCSAVLCDFYLNIIKSESRNTYGCNKNELFQYICDMIDILMSYNETILGIGVASIGPLDIREGIILNPPRFGGIKNLPLCNMLKARYNLPVYLDHQYNAAAIAEKLYGCAKDFLSFIFVGIKDGIGAGIYVNNRVLRGALGLGSELGHMSIDNHGVLCACGNKGCVENYACTTAILDRIKHETGIQMDFAQCCKSAENEVIDHILTDALDKLSVCLVSVVNLLNPEAIILGHESVMLPDKYLKKMERYINEHKLSGNYAYNRIKLLKPYYGEKSQNVGAACIILSKVFDGKLLPDI